jgi:hypothetical protein
MALVKLTKIIDSILYLRGQSVIIDADLARLYETSTKAINQAVKRNSERFPEDFGFQLSEIEKEEVVTNCDHLKKLKFSRTLPYAFTEHGVLMIAAILSSKQAIDMSIKIVRTFVQMREFLINNQEIILKINQLEKQSSKHDQNLKDLFYLVNKLIDSNQSQKTNKVGFI